MYCYVLFVGLLQYTDQAHVMTLLYNIRYYITGNCYVVHKYELL